MRRWGVVLGISGWVMAAPIVTAAPAHALCIGFFQRCPAPPTTTTTSPPAPPVTTPPVTAPPVATPPPPAAVDPQEAAAEFFDDTNAARAAAGLPALAWRDDVAAMAVAHSAEMAQQGSIWHGSFVSEANLKNLNAHALGENVGMGADVESIQAAFMASEHHRENILDSGFNQVGMGVVVSGATVYITEDFLQAKGGPVHASAPRPASHSTFRPAATARPASHAGTAPKAVAQVSAGATPDTAAEAAQAPVGVVTPVAPDAVPAAAAGRDLPPAPATGTSGWWALPLGGVVVAGTGGTQLRARRRRRLV